MEAPGISLFLCISLGIVNMLHRQVYTQALSGNFELLSREAESLDQFT